ncbi:MAG: hypothetical protein ACOCY7_00965 [Halodesulfurarchaeum sp.]
MVTPLEIGLLVLVLAALFGAYAIVRVVKPFIWNAVIGLIVLLLGSYLGIGVNITWLAILVVAIGGIPGALLVLILGNIGIIFTPAALIALLA